MKYTHLNICFPHIYIYVVIHELFTFKSISILKAIIHYVI